MIVTPKTRGFICTTAHPTGCAKNVESAAAYATAHPNPHIPKRVLVLGSSTGYGLAMRVAAAFGGGASTIGVSFEKQAAGKRTATAGHYNTVAFDRQAAEAGLISHSINGDAFSAEIKAQTLQAVGSLFPGGQVDLVVYSLAAPRRTSPDGVVHSSVIQPIGAPFTSKTLDFHTGTVSDVTLPPASPEEIADTISVMGGADWKLWTEALAEANLLAQGACTFAFSYIGPSLTHPIYKDGTIGQAKLDLEDTAAELSTLLAPLGGTALVSVNKAVVTQSSSAIPVVPLYISLLFKVMKETGGHEDCTMQAVRLLERLYPTEAPSDWSALLVDSSRRLRLDDWEMEPDIQATVSALWEQVTSENILELSDLVGYRQDFLRLFGFDLPGVDYTKPVDIFL